MDNQEIIMSKWTIDSATQHYNIRQWGEGYVGINQQGHLTLAPHRDNQQVDLFELSQSLHQQQIDLPVLVRFKDVLADRVNCLTEAFSAAISENSYQGKYTLVYPIKVNQQFSVVNAIANHKTHTVGLEAGSKPELLTVLGTAKDGSRIICNGYKDREYIRLALIGRALGFNVTIVIEKLSEVDLVLDESLALGIEADIGVRIRLASIGAGKWQNSGGDKAKFGLTANQILDLVERLKQADKIASLTMIHVHLGSQIANIRDIQKGVKEVARYYVELQQLGVSINTVDFGGGLGVDYEGTRSRSYNSMNYTLIEYARVIVHALFEACDRYQLQHPDIITESGRALTAHHALLITNIVDVDEITRISNEELLQGSSSNIEKELVQVCQFSENKSPVEVYHETVHLFHEANELYLHGVINLYQKAHCEKLFFYICRQLKQRLRPELNSHQQILDELHDKLASKYFMNLSIFQSIPDIWGIEQIFPVLPIHRLDEEPSEHVVLQDLTCDSDGKIDHYIDAEGLNSTLSLHPWSSTSPYLIGIFLVGAYQEILGDMHNLFGDTNSVDVIVNDDGFQISDYEPGDRVDEMMHYVHFSPERLIERFRECIKRESISEKQREDYYTAIIEGMSGYTYFES
jgi:arginine decarboxylase